MIADNDESFDWLKPDEVGYSTQDTDNIESDSSSSGSPNSERETPRKRGSPTPPSSDSSDESVLIVPKRKKNPAYALTPGHALRGPIDYSSKQGSSHYRNATKALIDDTKLELNERSYFTLMKLLEQRLKDFNMDGKDGITWVPLSPGTISSRVYSIITEHGLLKEEEVKDYVKFVHRYYDAILYDILMNSISEAAQQRIFTNQDYKIKISKGIYVDSGLMLLYAIIAECYINNKSSEFVLFQALMNIPEYMHQVDSDIDQFHMHVNQLLRKMEAIGSSPGDSLFNLLMNSYANVQDTNFISWLEHEKRQMDTYEVSDDRARTPTSLMRAAKVKFDMLKLEGRWMVPSAQDKDIQILKAEIKALKKDHRKKPSHLKGNLKKETDKEKAIKKANETDGKFTKAKFPDDPKWLKDQTPPPPGKEKEPRQHNKKDWHWCHASTGGGCGGVWRLHKPKDCRKKKDGGGKPQVSIKQAVHDDEIHDGYEE